MKYAIIDNGIVVKLPEHDVPRAMDLLATLEAAGFAERIPETGRIRPSMRLAQQAVSILRNLEAAKGRLDELTSRLTIQR